MIRIDQARIGEWITGHPAEVRGEPAVYPRPLAWWREFAPEWITVTEEPGGYIVLAPARTDGGAPERRARDEALSRFVREVRALAAAITAETATPVPGYPKVRHRTVDAPSCRYQVLVQEAPRAPWRVLGQVQRFGSLPSMRGWAAKRDADGAAWSTPLRLTRGDASQAMVDAWQKERQSCSR